MPVSKIPASETEEKTKYPKEVFDKRDLTILIPLVTDSKTDNDDIEKLLWEDYILNQEKVREFHKIRSEQSKFRQET